MFWSQENQMAGEMANGMRQVLYLKNLKRGYGFHQPSIIGIAKTEKQATEIEMETLISRMMIMVI